MTVFSDIYRHNRWKGTESLSGPGSGTAATQHVGPAIVDLVERYGITSVLDVGCGDGFWMPDLPGYVGVDVAPEAIERARARHPGRRYQVMDLTAGGAFDLIVCRDVAQHLTLEAGVALVAKARTWGRYLLASTYRGGSNVGCPPERLMRGWAYDNDLTAPPFSLGEPIEVIPDGYAYHGDSIRDERKVLGLWLTLGSAAL